MLNRRGPPRRRGRGRHRAVQGPRRGPVGRPRTRPPLRGASRGVVPVRRLREEGEAHDPGGRAHPGLSRRSGRTATLGDGLPRSIDRAACAARRRSARSCARPTLEPADLIAPLFVKEGIADAGADRDDARSVPAHGRVAAQGRRRHPVARRARVHALRGARAQGPEGSEAWNPDGIAQQAIRALRDDFGDDAVDHRRPLSRRVHRPRALRRAERATTRSTTTRRCELLRADRATRRRRPGAHLVGPSGMMDGQVGVIRAALDRRGADRRRDHGVRGEVRERPCTARSARRPRGRRGSATAPATSRIRRTPPRRSARSAPTSTRAPTS